MFSSYVAIAVKTRFSNPAHATMAARQIGAVLRFPRDYYTMSGTSMAAPMVSGAVVLRLQQYSNLTPDQVKAPHELWGSGGVGSSTTEDGAEAVAIAINGEN